MRSTLLCLLVICLRPLVACAQTTRPAPQIERVMIISVDGLRPDLLLRADTPTFHAMLERGTYSLWARTIPEAITLPSHTSMLTGVYMPKHGITWNDDRPADQRHPPRVPTLFQIAKQAGLTTAVVTGKSKFVTVVEAGGVDHHAVPDAKARSGDAAVAEMTVKLLRDHRPQITFVHLADVDGAGHGKGWGTPEQIATIERADAAVGLIFAAMDELGLDESTLVILSADHGGAGKQHGKGDARSRHIPWVAVGPGVRPGFDLTQIRELDIDTVDTFATACHYLGLPIPPHVEGKPIIQILPPDDLLGPATAPTTQPVAAP